MLRSAQPSQFSTYPSQYIDTPGLAVLINIQILIQNKETTFSYCIFQSVRLSKRNEVVDNPFTLGDINK